jgi:hypothetical protein
LRGQTQGAAKERKEQLWRDLVVAEFTLAVAAAWLTPLQPLARHLQGNVVARRLYLQSNIPQQLCAGSGCHVSFALSSRARTRNTEFAPLPVCNVKLSSNSAMSLTAAHLPHQGYASHARHQA